MEKISRRDFLKQAVFSFGALTFGKVLRIGETQEEPQLVDLQELNGDDEIFFEGLISNVDKDRFIVVNNGSPATLIVTEQTRLWKGKVTTLDQVEPGDFIYARGLPNPSGDFIALKVWVNIVNSYGTVAEIGSNRLLLRVGGFKSNVHLPIFVDSETILDEVKGIGIQNIHSDQFIQALGVYQRDGSLLATRIWTSL